MDVVEIVVYGILGLFGLSAYGLTLRFLTAMFGEEKQ